MNDHDQHQLQQLRKHVEDGQALVDLEKEKAMLSLEILEAILLRLSNLERRIDALEQGSS